MIEFIQKKYTDCGYNDTMTHGEFLRALTKDLHIKVFPSLATAEDEEIPEDIVGYRRNNYQFKELKHRQRKILKKYSKSGENRLKTIPVASFSGNNLGLFDMAGGVFEYCSDWYDGDCYRNSPERNPQGPAEGVYKVIRGGS